MLKDPTEAKVKTPTEEIQYLGLMLTATTIGDVGRIKSINARLLELIS